MAMEEHSLTHSFTHLFIQRLLIEIITSQVLNWVLRIDWLNALSLESWGPGLKSRL